MTKRKEPECRVCVICKNVFSTARSTKKVCNQICHIEYMHEKNKRWREANPEKVYENNKRWCEANPKKVREKDKRWREAHPERASEMKKRWNKANYEKVREQKARRYEADSEKVLERQRQLRQKRTAALAALRELGIEL